ncbi:MAG: hypothetical protein LBT44_02860 [Clostridiales bacterium]|jgi:DNA-directed RNA polymerase specialized sigma subunit|nr:hypothetical protein [Clostridiales bacterium]
MRWFIPFEQLFMYRLPKAPPKRVLNDYIVEYKRTGDEQYLAHFLHLYEAALNIRTENFCEHYGQLQHFQDIKQTIVAAMFLKLPDYDPEFGTTLEQFTELYVTEAVMDYIRQYCGAVSINESAFDTLREITAIYYYNPELSHGKRLAEIKRQKGYEEKKIRAFLQYGEMFRYSASLDATELDEDEGYVPLSERIGDPYGNPEYIVLRKLFIEAIATVLDDLGYRDLNLFLHYLGLRRIGKGFADDEPLPKTIIAAHSQIGSIDAVNKRFKQLVHKIKDELERQGWIEGENAPKLPEPPPLTFPINRAAFETIAYAVHKWEQSGKPDFNMIFDAAEGADGKVVLEFLALWLY